MKNGTWEVLTTTIWQARKAAYTARVAPWVADRTTRTARQQKNPVRDFLFEYYFQRASYLKRWSPGYGVVLEGAEPQDIPWMQFQKCDGGLILNASAFPPQRLENVKFNRDFLRTTLHREPFYGCFGLHEWAMVYKDGEVRHQSVPLRLSRDETNAVVERGNILCTHYDAFRFFAPSARTFNKVPLERTQTLQHDQPGCVHANMDLYKYAFVMSPFIPAEYVAEGFELALQARELDMRASPYDLRHYGLIPIEIETKRGREEYVEGQKHLYTLAQPLRQKLLAWYEEFLVNQTTRPEVEKTPPSGNRMFP